MIDWTVQSFGTLNGIFNDDEIKQMLANQHMNKKLIQPNKVANVVAFLFTEDASAVNGQTIPVDDGFLSFKV